MRGYGWIGLVVVAVVLGAVMHVSGEPRKPRQKRKPAPPPAVVQAESVVDGYGQSANAARARAMEKAQKEVERLLVVLFGETGWRPAEEQLDPAYLERYGVLHE